METDVGEVLRESTTVVVVGAGPAGITVGNLLQRCGIDCVVLELRSREYVEQRHRAGLVDYRAVRMLDEWGIAEELVGDTLGRCVMDLRVDGRSYLLGADEGTDDLRISLCPQQVFLRRSVAAFLAGGGDLRFEVADVALRGLTTDRPTVCYRDTTGAVHEIDCDFVAGCDGDHGVCRPSVPDDVLSAYTHDHGISWLTILAESPPPRHPVLAASDHGFCGHFFRGPGLSRFYLQCDPADQVSDWPAERVWPQLRARLGHPDLPAGPITSLEIFPLRCVVYEPMDYGRLFLLGDAAHIVAPTGGRGMNLALNDTGVFVRAVRNAIQHGDESGLRSYSAECLDLVWNYQEFSYWLTETLHDPSVTSRTGPFRQRLARARLARMTTSPTWDRAFTELLAGLT